MKKVNVEVNKIGYPMPVVIIKNASLWLMVSPRALPVVACVWAF